MHNGSQYVSRTELVQLGWTARMLAAIPVPCRMDPRPDGSLEYLYRKLVLMEARASVVLMGTAAGQYWQGQNADYWETRTRPSADRFRMARLRLPGAYPEERLHRQPRRSPNPKAPGAATVQASERPNVVIAQRPAGAPDTPASAEATQLDQRPPTSAAADHAATYKRLVLDVEDREGGTYGVRVERVATRPQRLAVARRAVMVRCQGRCENPSCGGQPDDRTDGGDAILEIDHVQDIALGGRDHPVQMVALCPNCHAMKTRGRRREELRAILLEVANGAHADFMRQARHN